MQPLYSGRLFHLLWPELSSIIPQMRDSISR
jgi:hypothetical protein